MEGRLSGYERAKTQLLIPEALNPPVTVTLEMHPLATRNDSAPHGSESPRAAAKRLATEGAAAYKVEDYAKAVEKFNAAYRLYPATPLLLNISRADMKLSRCNEALHFAEQFKAEATDIKATSPDSPDVWLATLRRSCIEAEVVSTPPDATIWIDGERQTAPGEDAVDQGGCLSGSTDPALAAGLPEAGRVPPGDRGLSGAAGAHAVSVGRCGCCR